jgi:hypothetical protein
MWLFLRHQVALYQTRKGISHRDMHATRLILVWLSYWFDWQPALTIVRPETFKRWRRQGWRLLLTKPAKPGRPLIPPELRATIEDRFTVRRPVVVTATEVMTTGEGETMEVATKMTVHAMADLLVDRLGIDATDAAMLIASAADVRAGLAGNPPYTMRVAVPRSMLAL